jgi:hypothetical protein
MTTPYDSLPRQSFWKASAALASEAEVDFDCGRKFGFAPAACFATAGSCFAQHFARRLAAQGANLLLAEDRHPLIPPESGHGYGAFSARFGNIYTVRHLRELVEQALGLRGPITEFAPRPDGRWVDMLRPRAVPMGFAGPGHALEDRRFHLLAVRRMLEQLEVLVFTLGLTEAWENVEHGYCYPVVPGAVAGEYAAQAHRFVNYGFDEVLADLRRVVGLLGGLNREARVLLTVSPVGLAATAEPRNVMVSSSASKSILRAAVDQVVREHPAVDYFPSYEIITGPYARGRYWAEGARDVTQQGVDVVMDAFVRSRMPQLAGAAPPAQAAAGEASDDAAKRAQAALEAECDELFLDPALRPRQ